MNDREITKIVEDVVNNIKSKPEMTLKLAKKLAEKVEEEAARIGVNAVVAVSNSGARPVLVECMDDSYIASYDVAFQKAYTVVALKMSTIQLKSISQPNQPLNGIQFTNGGQIVIFGGGDPLVHNSKIIGGIGVSGGTEEQDTARSAYGAECLKDILN